VNKIREGIGDKVAAFIQCSASFISGLILGIVWGWKLALVILAISPVFVLCALIMAKVSY